MCSFCIRWSQILNYTQRWLIRLQLSGIGRILHVYKVISLLQCSSVVKLNRSIIVKLHGVSFSHHDNSYLFCFSSTERVCVCVCMYTDVFIRGWYTVHNKNDRHTHIPLLMNQTVSANSTLNFSYRGRWIHEPIPPWWVVWGTIIAFLCTRHSCYSYNY